jgi:hypothetical protein
MDKDDLKYLLIWVPWELLAGAVLAYEGWPVKHNTFFWLLAGVVTYNIWEWRKRWML